MTWTFKPNKQLQKKSELDQMEERIKSEKKTKKKTHLVVTAESIKQDPTNTGASRSAPIICFVSNNLYLHNPQFSQSKHLYVSSSHTSDCEYLVTDRMK